MRTSSAKANGYRCPKCGDETTRDDKKLGFVRHKKIANCDFEKGMRDGAVGVDPNLNDAPLPGGGSAKTLKERVEAHIGVFFLGTLVAGFVAGIAVYRMIVEIAHLKIIGHDEYNQLLRDSKNSKPATPQRHTYEETIVLNYGHGIPLPRPSNMFALALKGEGRRFPFACRIGQFRSNSRPQVSVISNREVNKDLVPVDPGKDPACYFDSIRLEAVPVEDNKRKDIYDVILHPILKAEDDLVACGYRKEDGFFFAIRVRIETEE